MSHLSNDDDGYSSDSSNLTEDLTPEKAVKIEDDVKYLYVNIEKENVSMIHGRDRSLLNSALHLCELNGPRYILDLGCGTGTWAEETADKYPTAKVIGLDATVDLLPQWVPRNMTCQLGDYSELTDKDNRFDLIHIGHLDGCVRDWDAQLRRVYELLRPGGYVEWWEQSLTVIDGKTGKERDLDFIEELLTESRKRGMSLNVAPRLEHYLRHAGFEVRNVIVREIKFGDHMRLERRRLQAFADGLLGGSSDDSKLKVAITMDQLQKDDYMTLRWVSAQKPIQGSKPTEGSTSATTHDASRPINLNSVGQEQGAGESQCRSSGVLQIGQGASKRSHQEYNQDRISTSESPSPKTQPLSRSVSERVCFDLDTSSGFSENPEPSSKLRRILSSKNFPTHESMSRTSTALHNERLSGPLSTTSTATRIYSCGQTFVIKEPRLSHYKRSLLNPISPWNNTTRRNERPHYCSVPSCKQRFNQSYIQKAHMRTHASALSCLVPNDQSS